MPETRLVLIFALATLAMALLAWLTLFSVVSAKSRIIREQRKALAAEQRLRRSQETFADNAHHELKTPLQILLGNLQMLHLLDPSPEQAAMLSTADAATRRLIRLVQDLLDFTALHQGTLHIHAESTDLEAHLRLLLEDFGAQAAAKGLRFDADQAALPHLVVCDSPRLSRALAALLENAVRFTTSGSIRVRWTIQSEEKSYRMRFEVADTGPGLPADWPRLLQPFEQEAGRSSPSGLGLGLPLAAGLLRAMGGDMGLTPLAVGTLAWAEVELPKPTAP